MSRSDAADRLTAYADKLDRLKERFRYLGSAREDTKTIAAKAATRFAWHEQMIADLRAAADALR